MTGFYDCEIKLATTEDTEDPEENTRNFLRVLSVLRGG
jgi:hypothetical protein